MRWAEDGPELRRGPEGPPCGIERRQRQSNGARGGLLVSERQIPNFGIPDLIIILKF